MTVDILTTWKSTLFALPNVGSSIWSTNFSQWYADRIANIEPNPTSLVPTTFVFTFPVSTFATALAALTNTNNATTGITGFADAWKSAIQTMAFPATLSVATGAFEPPATSASTFSSVASVVIDPASITAAYNKILELATSPNVSGDASEFPKKFRDATLLLTITVSGDDSTTPGDGGPLALTVANIPLI